MKPDKKGIIAVSAILIVAVISAVTFITLTRRNSTSVYMNEDLKNVDNIKLISHCSEIDGTTNSIAGFKESVRLGANAVIMDLCFRKDGTPVITDNYSEVDRAETVAQLFETMSNESYKDICVYLNIVQLSDLSELNNLAVQYNIVDRTFLMGIDSEHYDIISTDDTILPFLLDYTFSKDELNALSEGNFSKPDIIEKYGASGLVIDFSQISEELIEALNDYGIIFLTDGIGNTSDMCMALIKGADNIIVPDVEKSRKTVDEWTLKMQERYKESVEKSIKALSEKSDDNSDN